MSRWANSIGGGFRLEMTPENEVAASATHCCGVVIAEVVTHGLSSEAQRRVADAMIAAGQATLRTELPIPYVLSTPAEAAAQ